MTRKLFGRRREGAQPAPQQPARPDVALVFDEARGESVFAVRAGGDIRVRRCKTRLLRDELGGVLSGGDFDFADSGAEFLTVAPHFTEETLEAPLGSAQVALADDELLLFLADAERTGAAGDGGEPYVHDAARDPGNAWDFARTPHGGATVTSCARAALDAAASMIAGAALGYDPSARVAADEEVYLEFRCETMARAALRAQLASLPPGAAPDDERLVTAFFGATHSGACVGLYSPERGFFLEEAEPFQTGGEFEDAGVLASSVAHALSNLLLRLAPSALSAMGFTGVHSVWWAAPPALREIVRREMSAFQDEYAVRFASSYSEHSSQSFGEEVEGITLDDVQMTTRHVEVEEACAPLDELAARGLLLASSADGGVTPPPINLADSAADRAESLVEERTQEAAVDYAVLQGRVRTAAFVPLLLVLGLLFGGYVVTLWQARVLEQRLESARQEKARLAPVAARREGATAVMAWVGAYLDQVAELRRRQPASLSLLAALDARYPLGEDESFTVKSLTVQSNGQLEIQGLTKKDAAVEAFVTSLEYSPTDGAGRKLFENPVYELRKQQVGGINLPSLPSGQNSPFQSSVQSPRPDVAAFTVRALYTPLQRDSAVTAPPAKAKGDESKKPDESKAEEK